LRGRVTLNLGDNQRIVQLVVGESFTLDLGDELNWQIQIGEERIVARMDSGAASGGSGVYKALAAGRTELIAIGAPPCAEAQPPCLMPDTLFQVTIIVR
jgi:hypothetical protein